MGESEAAWVLVVDDDVETRLTLFKRFFKGVPFTFRRGPRFVTDADLQAAKMVFLDHAMCERWMTQSEDTDFPIGPCPTSQGAHCTCSTGLDVAKQLLACGAKPLIVVAHTASSVGGRAIVDRLDKHCDVVHAPFAGALFQQQLAVILRALPAPIPTPVPK